MPEHLAVHSGAQVSHYILKEPLGQGNLTQTWRAIDHRDGSEVALRIFSDWLSHSAETRERLEQEVALLQLITHPALVPIACAEFHEGNRPSFLATPFIPGASLMRRLAAKGPMSVIEALQLLEPVIDVVAVLHRAGIVHENIRPSNIVIDTSSGKAHLTDSDLSRAVELPAPPLPGSYEYMSPELLNGNGTTAASDIYSIGCVLYEMLTGMPPFTGTAEQVRIQQREDSPMPLESRDPAVPAKFAMTVMRCLEKDPTKRYESGESLQSAFGLTAGLKISLLNPNATKRSPVALPRPTSKQPVWATFSAVLAGLTFAGWAGYAFAPPRPLDLARARELQRLRQLDWNQVTADDMPSDCLGYQPCMDRRQAINTVVH